jgi:hypothetical protein
MSDSADDLGFNDDELADIMNEIESLEAEFTTSDAGAPTTAPSEPSAEPEVESVENARPVSDGPEAVASTETPEVAEQAEELSAVQEDNNGQELSGEADLAEAVDVEEASSPEPIADAEPVVAESNEQQTFEQQVADDPLFQGGENPRSLDEAKDNNMQGSIDESIEAGLAANNMNCKTNQVSSSGTKKMLEGQTQSVEQKVVNLVPTPTAEHSPKLEQGVTPAHFEFKVSGDMCLSFAFEVGGKRILANLSGEKGLELDIEGGVQLTVPLETDKKAS